MTTTTQISTTTLNQYVGKVSVTDGRMHSPESTVISTFDIAVLATSIDEANSLIIKFYSQSGLASKLINGLHTIYQSSPSNIPGAIRTVKIQSLTLNTPGTSVITTPPPVKTNVSAAVGKPTVGVNKTPASKPPKVVSTPVQTTDTTVTTPTTEQTTPITSTDPTEPVTPVTTDSTTTNT